MLTVHRACLHPPALRIGRKCARPHAERFNSSRIVGHQVRAKPGNRPAQGRVHCQRAQNQMRDRYTNGGEWQARAHACENFRRWQALAASQLQNRIDRNRPTRCSKQCVGDITSMHRLPQASTCGKREQPRSPSTERQWREASIAACAINDGGTNNRPARATVDARIAQRDLGVLQAHRQRTLARNGRFKLAHRTHGAGCQDTRTREHGCIGQPGSQRIQRTRAENPSYWRYHWHDLAKITPQPTHGRHRRGQ